MNNDIVVEYDKYPSEFVFKLDAEMYSDLTPGTATITLWVTDDNGYYEAKETWWIELQEFME